MRAWVLGLVLWGGAAGAQGAGDLVFETPTPQPRPPGELILDPVDPLPQDQTARENAERILDPDVLRPLAPLPQTTLPQDRQSTILGDRIDRAVDRYD